MAASGEQRPDELLAAKLAIGGFVPFLASVTASWCDCRCDYLPPREGQGSSKAVLNFKLKCCGGSEAAVKCPSGEATCAADFEKRTRSIFKLCGSSLVSMRL